QFSVFFEYARTTHKILDHPSALPYAANSFDIVLGSGVLEHVPMDYESLKELYRILSPDGVLAISYLPNWLSINEWHRRIVRRREFHRRLYGMSEIRQLLKRVGFYPIAADYHTFFWPRLVERAGLAGLEPTASKLLARLAPVQILSSTLRIIAQKVQMM